MLPLTLWANCIKVTSTSSLSAAALAAGYTASSWTGACDTCSGNLGLPSVISINSGTSFQPAGSLLASSVGSFLTSASNTAYSPNQILYRCAVADAGSLYEMYATNGDSAYAGMYASSEVSGAYYDVAKNVAVRMTNLTTGEYYSRYWKSRQFTADSWYSDGTYLYIPASAFSNVLYEMFKISSTSYYANGDNRYSDLWTQPRGYTAFKGPGLDTNSLAVGQDSASYWYGFYGNWPAAWSTYRNVTYVRGALCEVQNYPSVVLLPTISVNALKAGGSSQVPFSISLQCESGARSSTSTSTSTAANVAMGLLVNQPNAVSQATQLGLTTSGGGLTWLLDNQYGSSGVASGVGIKIYNASGSAINLLPNLASTGTGNTRGWYAYTDLTSLVSSGSSNIYSGDFLASLEAISGQTVTAGTVNAQLQVVVSFQ
ncbi:fimbrial usher protein StbD [Pantoea sp. Taur]|uniref:fimbrial usher protein StbD n=1 Tax=Pantoea sp. Taur TaxID=2576757 RepID=UPI0019296FDE|nr:fimbrial usher protein StbD [Pantoea sp. Taur]